MNTSVRYEIQIEGHLGISGSAWFAGLTICHEESGTTILVGEMDQAALHGVLMRIRDLGMPLLSVNRVVGEAKLLIWKEKEGR